MLPKVDGVGRELGLETVPIRDKFRGGDCSVFGDDCGRQNAGVIELLGGNPPRARWKRTPHKLRTNSFLALAFSLRATLAQRVDAQGPGGSEALSIRRTFPLKTLGSCSISLRKCVRSSSTNFRKILEKSVPIFVYVETVTQLSP
jgi:hypothetical protein